MNIIIVLILCWASVSYGGLAVPRQLARCPLLPCAAPFCDDYEIQYFTYNGMQCPGCPVCTMPAPEKRQIQVQQFLCPVVDCVYLVDCTVAWETGTIIIDGHECPGCLTCPVPGTGLQTE